MPPSRLPLRVRLPVRAQLRRRRLAAGVGLQRLLRLRQRKRSGPLAGVARAVGQDRRGAAPRELPLRLPRLRAAAQRPGLRGGGTTADFVPDLLSRPSASPSRISRRPHALLRLPLTLRLRRPSLSLGPLQRTVGERCALRRELRLPRGGRLRLCILRRQRRCGATPTSPLLRRGRPPRPLPHVSTSTQSSCGDQRALGQPLPPPQ